MKRPFAIIYLDDLHIRYFDAREEVADAVKAAKSVDVLVMKYHPAKNGYVQMEVVTF